MKSIKLNVQYDVCGSKLIFIASEKRFKSMLSRSIGSALLKTRRKPYNHKDIIYSNTSELVCNRLTRLKF